MKEYVYFKDFPVIQRYINQTICIMNNIKKDQPERDFDELLSTIVTAVANHTVAFAIKTILTTNDDDEIMYQLRMLEVPEHTKALTDFLVAFDAKITIGKFVVLEGTDGIGKSTILDLVDTKYPDVHITREPGGTMLSEVIRENILDITYKKEHHRKTEILLYYASRAQHIEEKVKPMREAGYDIFSSRFYDSSYAYQLTARGVNKVFVDALTLLVCDDIYSTPSAVVAMYVDNISTVTDRMRGRQGDNNDRLESEGESFMAKTNDYFKNIKPPIDFVKDFESDRIISHRQEIAVLAEKIDNIGNRPIHKIDKRFGYDTYPVECSGSIQSNIDQIDDILSKYF